MEDVCGKLYHQELDNKEVLAAHKKCMVTNTVLLSSCVFFVVVVIYLLCSVLLFHENFVMGSLGNFP